MPDDWTTLLTEEERNWLKVAQAYIPKAIALRVAGMDPKAGETEAVVIEFARSLAALRALVAELRREGEYLLQDIGPCADKPGMSCSQHPWAGVARCSARDFGSALALKEADMRERLEEK